ncbi:MvaI/BcnI restriction endonuclease family protein [Lysobacter ciconiae]|uniref:MvaI/BcnI restriction endonuclease family protein n=1 Tax=Novilysobacter ciconiae TaxID=2781022 RepID=A0A7S6ZT24_9GAMM|nr:MvaI/BcnI family restriction endonuclease [Lysobacter ciconiae]QOW20493.1 MvaI/BcnI restriction endonuclease family protein [Lysobacter ciconiae]
MDYFADLKSLLSRFRDIGATRIFYKLLSENDNSKQQIYLGGSFEVLTFFPYGNVHAEPGLKDPTFKAPLEYFWVGPSTLEKARAAQLILYPRYPEVRLSGFLRGCRTAPNEHLRPIPRDMRKGVDGRALFFGTTADGRTLAHLEPAGSPLAFEATLAPHADAGVFKELPVPGAPSDSRSYVLDRLRQIQQMGAIPSIRLNKTGDAVPYNARNGGGYTLEALLGIKPNGDAAPDFMGWEIKAFSSDRITLMTPEPNGGFYGSEGVGAFVRRYGRPIPDKDQLYFTGAHQFGKPNARTAMTLGLCGFDATKSVINDVSGRIVLSDGDGNEAATWSYSHLLTHWNRKHASAAYVPFKSESSTPPCYRYVNPVLLGERTDFSKYLSALAAGLVVFDPGSKVDAVSTARPRVKARSQFRMSKKHLAVLYESFNEINLSVEI